MIYARYTIDERRYKKMNNMFNLDGRLHIPNRAKIYIPYFKFKSLEDNYVVEKAYCSKNHSLLSNIRINGSNGIHLLTSDLSGKKQCNVVISAFAGTGDYVVLSGEPFHENDIVKVFCPKCKTELDILFDCECGAHIYVIYGDKDLDWYYGWSFCSRVGCSKMNMLQFSKKTLQGFYKNYEL